MTEEEPRVELQPVEEEEDREQVQEEQRVSQPGGEEDLLRQEAEVHSPDMEELPSEIEGSVEVFLRELEEKGCGERELQQEAEQEMRQGTENTETLPEEDTERRREEECIHLDSDGEGEEQAPEDPSVALEAEDPGEGEQHADWIVEESQNEDTVNPFAKTEKENRPLRNHPTPVVELHEEELEAEVESEEEELREEDVLSALRHPVQEGKQIHEASRIHERPCVALHLTVITLTGQETILLPNLLHVGLPVDLRVCRTVTKTVTDHHHHHHQGNQEG